MEEVHVDPLEASNRRLAGRLRRTQIFLVMTFILAFSSLVANLTGLASKSHKVLKTLEVERFVLRHPDGSARVEMTTAEDASWLVFYDNFGKRRVSLSVQPDGASVFSLHDEAEKAKFILRTNHKGGTALGFLDDRESAKLSMGTKANDEPALSFHDSTGEPQLDLELTLEGEPMFSYRTKKKKWIQLIDESKSSTK